MTRVARNLLDDPLSRKLPERRSTPRHAVALQTSFRALAGATGIYWDGSVQDLSAGGISVRTYRQFPVGTVLILKLHLGKVTVDTVVRVVRVQPLEEDQFVFGAVFANKLSDTTLAVLLPEQEP